MTVRGTPEAVVGEERFSSQWGESGGSDPVGTIDYLVLGHVTRDLTPEGDYVLGGTVSFASSMAHALGCQVGIFTTAESSTDLTPLKGLPIICQPSRATTTFENRYTESGRIQYLHERAAQLNFGYLPPVWRQAPIVHLGPLANEIDVRSIDLLESPFVGITPQGWLRGWDKGGRVFRTEWPEAAQVLPKVQAVVLSIEDVDDDWGYLESWAEQTAVLAVTEAEKGATIFVDGEKWRFQAPHVSEVDPTGAGDLFASSFFIRYQQSGNPWVAAKFAVALASASVSRPGLSGLPTSEEIEAALQLSEDL